MSHDDYGLQGTGEQGALHLENQAQKKEVKQQI